MADDPIVLDQNTDSSEQPERSEGIDAQKSGDYTGPMNANGESDLPAELVTAFTDLCTKLDQRDRVARLNQVARCQKARFFWRGQQYLNREKDDQAYTINPVTTPLWKQGGQADPPKATINLYLGYGKVWVATFSQTPCGVRFEPNDPMIERQVQAAKEADSARKIVTKINAQKDIQKKVARLAWTDGLIVFHSRKVTDGSKFGVDADGNPRSYPEIDIGGALEWKVPISAGNFDEWDYCRNQREISLSRAKALYPDKREKLQASAGGLGGDSDLSRQARISTQEGITGNGAQYRGQSGDAAALNVTRSYYWLRPSAYEELTEDKRKLAEEYFPKGARLTFVGESYVESLDEDMADHISVLVAVDGEGYNCPGLGDPAIDPQEMVNCFANIQKDCFERCVPHSYFDDQLIQAESINQQKSEYGYQHPVTMPQDGTALQAHFHTEDVQEPPQALVIAFNSLLNEIPQFLTGQQPALFGGQMSKDDRVGVYSQARSMALGLMGLVWIPFKTVWANVMRQSVKILADTYGQGTQLAVMVNGETGKPQVVKVSIDNLKGDFLAYPDTDESYPETWQEEKAQYQQLMDGADKSPELAQMLNHPDNRRRGMRYTGIELTDTVANAYDKQLGEIEEMEKEPPVPDPQAVMQIQQQVASGQMPPEQGQMALRQIQPVSSVDIDSECDDHATEGQACMDWLNDPQRGQKAKRENPAWFMNVRLHGLKHKQLASQNNAPQTKPPNQSINFKDLPPEGKAQMAAEVGINLDTQALAAKQATDQAAAMSRQ